MQKNKKNITVAIVVVILLVTALIFDNVRTAPKGKSYLGSMLALSDEEDEDDDKEEEKEEDEDEDGDEKGDENEDADEDKDEDEAEKKEAEKAKEAQKKAAEAAKEVKKKEAEKTKEAQQKMTEKDGEDDEDDDKNELEENDEDEDEDEAEDEESVTREIVNNADGSTIETIIKTEEDEIKTIVITRDQNGNIIERKVTESEDGKEEIKTTAYDVYGKKLSEIEIKTVDGKTIKIEAQEGDQKVRYETESGNLVIDYEDDDGEEFNEEDDEIKIKVVGDAFELKKKDVKIKINFPMEVDGETGQIYVVTPNGKVELKAMPDIIAQKAQDAGLDNISKFELKIDGNKVKYEVNGTQTEKFLGLVRVKIKSTYQYDSENGELLGEAQSFWQGVLIFLSF